MRAITTPTCSARDQEGVIVKTRMFVLHSSSFPFFSCIIFKEILFHIDHAVSLIVVRFIVFEFMFEDRNVRSLTLQRREEPRGAGSWIHTNKIGHRERSWITGERERERPFSSHRSPTSNHTNFISSHGRVPLEFVFRWDYRWLYRVPYRPGMEIRATNFQRFSEPFQTVPFRLDESTIMQTAN